MKRLGLDTKLCARVGAKRARSKVREEEDERMIEREEARGVCGEERASGTLWNSRAEGCERQHSSHEHTHRGINHDVVD